MKPPIVGAATPHPSALRRALAVSVVIAVAAALSALLGALGPAWVVAVAGTVLNLAGTVLALFTVRRREVALHGMRCLLYLALAGVCLPLTLARIDAAERAAEPLIAALAAYHAAHGTYPKVLGLLPAATREAIPPAFVTPLVRGRFTYVYTPDSYFLVFDPVGATPFIYDPQQDAWAMRD